MEKTQSAQVLEHLQQAREAAVLLVRCLDAAQSALLAGGGGGGSLTTADLGNSLTKRVAHVEATVARALGSPARGQASNKAPVPVSAPAPAPALSSSLSSSALSVSALGASRTTPRPWAFAELKASPTKSADTSFTSSDIPVPATRPSTAGSLASAVTRVPEPPLHPLMSPPRVRGNGAVSPTATPRRGGTGAVVATAGSYYPYGGGGVPHFSPPLQQAPQSHGYQEMRGGVGSYGGAAWVQQPAPAPVPAPAPGPLVVTVSSTEAVERFLEALKRLR